jgi:hypothetical protein
MVYIIGLFCSYAPLLIGAQRMKSRKGFITLVEAVILPKFWGFFHFSMRDRVARSYRLEGLEIAMDILIV